MAIAPNGLISADCSSQDHDEALKGCYSCERIENHINDYNVAISEKLKLIRKEQIARGKGTGNHLEFLLKEF